MLRLLQKDVAFRGVRWHTLSTMNLLSINADAKTRKGTSLGILTGILYLAPSDESEVINTCSNATKGCRLSCLFTAGRGAFSNVRKARIAKTVWFARDRDGFMNQLVKDINALIRKAIKMGMQPAIRLNGTSDIAWETIKDSNGDTIFDRVIMGTQFYDYTKSESRMIAYLQGKMPSNYHMTYSRSENDDGFKIMEMGGNVAVVFAGNSMPDKYMGIKVINADLTDVRFMDPKGVVCGLRAKGRARKDKSGFVVAV